MVKKELKLLDGPPEFNEYVEKVKIPNNIPAHKKDEILESVRLVDNAKITEDMSDEEILSNVENTGELMKQAQNVMLDFALKHCDKDLERDNLTKQAATKILEQYSDQVQGVEVKKNWRDRLKTSLNGA